MSDTELKVLRFTRGQIKAQLTRFKKYLNEFDTTKSIIELSKRLNNIETLWGEFGDCQSKIELLDSNELKSEERSSFEDDFYETIAKAQQYILNSQAQTSISVTNQSASTPSSAVPNILNNVKLPTIKLIEFNGMYTGFTQFIDSFNALVHNNPNISNVQKFFYLNSCLKNEPLQVISSLEITDGNYQIALDLLKERYENKRVIINNHLKQLFELPVLYKENAVALRKLLDCFTKHKRALENLEQKTDTWHSILVYLLSSKLDAVTKKAWEISITPTKLPTIEDLTKFLGQRCQVLETLNPVQYQISTNNNNKHINKGDKHDVKTFAHLSTNKIRCPFCKEPHFIYKCTKFMNLPVQSRLAEVQRMKLCTNCFRSNHNKQECISGGCKRCNKKHNTLLHFDRNDHDTNTIARSSQNISVTNESVESNQINDNNTIAMCSANSTFTSKFDTVLLSTAVVYIFDHNNRAIKCRALLDSASMSNFISKSLFEKLSVPGEQTNIPIFGINNSVSKSAIRTKAKIKSLYNSYNKVLPFFVLDNISGKIPYQSIPISKINVPSNIQLADNEFNQSHHIDILVGAQIYHDLLCVGQIKSGNDQPIFQKSKFGWIVSGPVTFNQSITAQTCLMLTNNDVQDQLERFWQIEETGFKHNFLSKEENFCEQHFENNFKRDKDGRFIVSLPLKEEHIDLGDTMNIAIKRLLTMERKFSNNENLHKKYTEFMQEYVDMNHMTLIKNVEEISSPTNQTYYLPHHAVEKQSSLTTKLRVVFNASQKGNSGHSLNDILCVGPTVQNDLVSIITRFRTHNIVIKADIAKMYRQINIEENQRDLQRIVWRTKPDEKISHYRLNTVTYGTASASFLATRCLKQISIEIQNAHPIESRSILKDFYMDDLITGGDNIENVQLLKTNLQNILKDYGFELRQWMSNNRIIIDNRDSNISLPHYHITDDKTIKTLGVLWNSETDCLEYSVQGQSYPKNVTKRTVLSNIAKIFDPLGLISPVVIRAKIILQNLWKLKLDWEESIPQDLYTRWNEFVNQLPFLNNIQFSRQVIVANYASIQLHGFSDASNNAFGACIYLRTTDRKGKHHVNLLIAKSKVAPLKVITLPRLELCASVLLAQLAAKTIESLNLKISKQFYWTDSQIVLSWIAAEPSSWKTFVCNRVAQIQELTSQGTWNHVSSSDNPADIVSRGCTSEQLISSNLWHHGPAWLKLDKPYWPITSIGDTLGIPEGRITLTHITTLKTKFDLITKFSSYTKLRHVMSYVLRFINNLKSKSNERMNGPLLFHEINKATNVLIKIVQLEEFEDDIKRLTKLKIVLPNSKLKSLNPFLDHTGILRVGGRLNNTLYPYARKHPVVLPSKSHFTNLIINHEHNRLLHAGCQAVLSSIRDKFWPLSGRRAVRRQLRQCITCFRTKPESNPPIMGDIPKSRLTACRPFTISGVDYAGPFLLKDGKTRNRQIVKAYICLFICFNTKAVHIELAGDLSTESFLNCLKRFVARRGLCSELYSDNATNFVGAKNHLQKIVENVSLSRYLTENQVSWKFIPPRASHFGGLWERNIRSIKHHLKVIIGDAHLTFENFYTVLTQIEGVLNSRPLCPLSNDPNDFEPLTPGHFLIGASMYSLPQEDVVSRNPFRLNDYQRNQQLVQHFWLRWSKEYVNNLQQRTKWQFQRAEQLEPGHMVLIKDDNVPPMRWLMGRIVKVYPGSDGNTRVVDVKTKNGLVKRAFSKICVLPIDIN